MTSTREPRQLSVEMNTLLYALGLAREARDEAKGDAVAARELLKEAWGIIANAGGGNWGRESKEWQEAAAKFRDEFHKKVGHL